MSRFQKSRFKMAGPQKSNTSNSIEATLKAARKSGVLNLSNREFEEVPDAVWNIYDPPTDEERKARMEFGSSDNWWDQVDLRKLYLTSNKLKSLSTSIKHFKALQVLDVQDNQLTALPGCIGELDRLESLNVSYNKIDHIDFEFVSAEHLYVIMLQHNKILEISPSFFLALQKCGQLNLSHNLLKNLPLSIESLCNIRLLNLSHNSLVTLPEEIGNLRNLSQLDVSNNAIITLPDNICNMVKLEQFYLSNNRLCCFPNMQSCTSLKELCLGNNQLPDVPEGLPSCLCILELGSNKIKALSDHILKIEMLERLDLVNNDINQISPKVSLLPNLKVITLDGNPIKSIRRDIINRGSAAVLKYLQTRLPVPENDTQVAKSLGKSSLPQSDANQKLSKAHEVSSSKKLHFVDVDSADVESDLKEFSAFDLIDIEMKKCKISEVPSVLVSYKNSLKKLSLPFNRISTFPLVVCELVALTHIDLSCNALTALPNEFSNLQSLLEVNIVNNRFSSLPKSFYKILSLEHILADGNQITSIEVDGLSCLKTLSTLSLKNNNIATVPPELGKLEQIRNLSIDGNVFRVPRQAILQKGTLAILEYLRSRIIQ